MIEVRELNVVKKGRTILSQINLKIEEGEKILIRGESGSGKSTLLKSILFFERFNGSVLFKNQEVGEANLFDFRNHIGYIGQIIPNLDETIIDFIKIPYRYRANRHLSVDQYRIKRLMSDLNFDESLLEKNYRDLSGGEKQRLLILQILLLDKSVCVLDEVTANLDEANINRAIKLITGNPKRTVISVSHHPGWEKSSSRLIEMKAGRITRNRWIS